MRLRIGHALYYVVLAAIGATLLMHVGLSLRRSGNFHKVQRRPSDNPRGGAAFVVLPGLPGLSIEEVDPGIERAPGAWFAATVAATAARDASDEGEEAAATDASNGAPIGPVDGAPAGDGSACADGGPWPCAETGCPASELSCADLAYHATCEGVFGKVFIHVPRSVDGASTIADRCPMTCRRCGAQAHREAALLAAAEAARIGRAAPVDDGGGFTLQVPMGENLGYRAPRALALCGGIEHTVHPLSPFTRHSVQPLRALIGPHADATGAHSLRCRYRGFSDATSWQADGGKRRTADARGCRRFFSVGERGDMLQTVSPIALKGEGVHRDKHELERAPPARPGEADLQEAAHVRGEEGQRRGVRQRLR